MIIDYSVNFDTKVSEFIVVINRLILIISMIYSLRLSSYFYPRTSLDAEKAVNDLHRLLNI